LSSEIRSRLRPRGSESRGGDGATRPLPRDGGVEELYEYPIIGPICTNVLTPQRGAPKWRGNSPVGFDHPVTHNRLKWKSSRKGLARTQR